MQVSCPQGIQIQTSVMLFGILGRRSNHGLLQQAELLLSTTEIVVEVSDKLLGYRRYLETDK
jgi:hypothetical protein